MEYVIFFSALFLLVVIFQVLEYFKNRKNAKDFDRGGTCVRCRHYTQDKNPFYFRCSRSQNLRDLKKPLSYCSGFHQKIIKL